MRWRQFHHGIRRTALIACSASALLAGVFPASASLTGPFGTGLPDDQGFSAISLFPRLVGFLISIQIYFNQHLTAAVHAMHQDANAFWTLLGLSFFYGIAHAAGPGHGKAVVSSYVLATRQTLRNGIVLALITSLAQAAGAIILILVASTVLHMTSVSITWTTFQFEVVSDAFVLLLGCWLVWTKIIKPARSLNLAFEPVTPLTQPQLYLQVAPTNQRSRFLASEVGGAPNFSSLSQSSIAFSAPTSPDPCDCGSLHMPDASRADGTLDWRKAWTIVASTALRPCTGALIVLVFSISQGLLAAGVASVITMGLGTAVTVIVLAVLAVSARKTAFALTGTDSALGYKLKRAVEVGAALIVVIAGILLLIGDVYLQ